MPIVRVLLPLLLLAAPVASQSSVHLVELATGRESLLAEAKAVRRPAIAPDGRAVAYQVIDSAGFFVYVTRTDDMTTSRHRLQYEPLDFEMRWSPDGQWLAFRADPQGVHSSRIQLLHPVTGEERTLVSELAEQFVWSADSRTIRFVGHGPVHTVREVLLTAESTDLRVLEADIPAIGGIQFQDYAGLLVGSPTDGVYHVPLPAGPPRLITNEPRRFRVSSLPGLKVAVPLRNPDSAVDVIEPNSPTVRVELPFQWVLYYVSSLPTGELVIAGTLAGGGYGMYAVASGDTARLLWSAPPGTAVDWFDVSSDGRFLAVAVSLESPSDG